MLLFGKIRIFSGLNLTLVRQGTAGLELVSEEQIRNGIKYVFRAEILQEKRFKEGWQQERERLSVSMSPGAGWPIYSNSSFCWERSEHTKSQEPEGADSQNPPIWAELQD